MNKKQGKPLKMRLFFFLVTHIDGKPAALETVGVFDLPDKFGNSFLSGKIFVYGYVPDVNKGRSIHTCCFLHIHTSDLITHGSGKGVSCPHAVRYTSLK